MKLDYWQGDTSKEKVAEYFRKPDIICDYYINPKIPDTIFAEFDIFFGAKYLYLIHFYQDKEMFIFELFKQTDLDSNGFESGVASIKDREDALEYIIKKIVEETIHQEDLDRAKEIIEILKMGLIWKK